MHRDRKAEKNRGKMFPFLELHFNCIESELTTESGVVRFIICLSITAILIHLL